MYPNIEPLLGLHQRLEVIYLVDKYQATLFLDDDRVIAEGNGTSVEQALTDLDTALSFIPKLPT